MGREGGNIQRGVFLAHILARLKNEQSELSYSGKNIPTLVTVDISNHPGIFFLCAALPLAVKEEEIVQILKAFKKSL